MGKSTQRKLDNSANPTYNEDTHKAKALSGTSNRRTAPENGGHRLRASSVSDFVEIARSLEKTPRERISESGYLTTAYEYEIPGKPVTAKRVPDKVTDLP